MSINVSSPEGLVKGCTDKIKKKLSYFVGCLDQSHMKMVSLNIRGQG